MLQSIAEIVKTYFVPGSFTFLLFGLTAGVALAYGPRRARRIAVPLLTVLTLGYWIASVPVVSDALSTRFHAAESQSVTAADIADAQAIVLLGAGVRSYVSGGHTATLPYQQTIYNAFEAARLFRLLSGRAPIIASGGGPEGHAEPESSVLRDLLLRAGVPEHQILLESASRTTHEQAVEVAPLLKAHHWRRVVLIAPPVQLPRAAAVFRAQGVDPIPVAAPVHSDGGKSPTGGWIPNGGALNASTRAMYDYLAWGYYWMRGWLKPSSSATEH
jgi:uncharacterized SAM-binding protein YcdF (DUF218 family)